MVIAERFCNLIGGKLIQITLLTQYFDQSEALTSLLLSNLPENERVTPTLFVRIRHTHCCVAAANRATPLFFANFHPTFTYLTKQAIMAAESSFKWTAGLINCSGKYLVAEKFQFRVTTNAVSLRKKETWTLEQVTDTHIAIKSCFGRYLGCDKDGKVSGDAEEIGDDNKFQFDTQEDGRVAIKTFYNRYFSGTGDNLSGFSLEMNTSSYWRIQLALMPQMNLRNVNRKAYAHLVGQEICVNEVVPWGHDATISIDYQEGKYSIRASDGRYLSRTGVLQEVIDDSCLFVLVFRGSQVAFRDSQGKYLAGVGASATLQSRKDKITRDELFTFEDTNPQIVLMPATDQASSSTVPKYVSVRQGIEIRANQGEVEDFEIFQMEAVDRSDMSGNVKWAFSSKRRQYWTAKNPNSLECTANDFSSPDAQFTIEWQGPMIAIKASNDKYVSAKSGGQLVANSDSCDSPSSKFIFEIVNHPYITLRCEHGFVGPNALKRRPTVECNRAQYDVLKVCCEAGTYRIKSSNDKYWQPEGESIYCDGEKVIDWFIEFRAHTHLCIMAPNGQYVKGKGNGEVGCNGGDEVKPDVLWEF